jgi:hypothetical protein
MKKTIIGALLLVSGITILICLQIWININILHKDYYKVMVNTLIFFLLNLSYSNYIINNFLYNKEK